MRMVLMAGGLLVAAAVHADELTTIEAAPVSLGEVSGVAYYTRESDGFRVVATLSGPTGSPVHFTATLHAGQTAVVSVPGEPGRRAEEAAISRVGDTVQITKEQKLGN
jgi:hypothetical protein